MRHVEIVKETVAAKRISNGEEWMSAWDARNKMSHVYDVKQFDAVIEKIEATYLDCFGELHEKLSGLC